MHAFTNEFMNSFSTDAAKGLIAQASQPRLNLTDFTVASICFCFFSGTQKGISHKTPSNPPLHIGLISSESKDDFPVATIKATNLGTEHAKPCSLVILA